LFHDDADIGKTRGRNAFDRRDSNGRASSAPPYDLYSKTVLIRGFRPASAPRSQAMSGDGNERAGFPSPQEVANQGRRVHRWSPTSMRRARADFVGILPEGAGTVGMFSTTLRRMKPTAYLIIPRAAASTNWRCDALVSASSRAPASTFSNRSRRPGHSLFGTERHLRSPCRRRDAGSRRSHEQQTARNIRVCWTASARQNVINQRGWAFGSWQ
jgi:hypothetical protein